MYLSAAILGVDPGDIRESSVGFADFCCQILAQDWALDCFCTSEARYTGKDPRDFNIATICILKMKDPYCGDWVHLYIALYS